MSAVVEIQNVTKKFKGKTIIDSLNFNVNKGEVFGFLGPNGAGKTTTIRMMVGLISMTSGDIKISGCSIKKDFEKAISQVGGIVENPEMYKFLTGYQNLLHYARMSKGIKQTQIQEAVRLVGLSERIHDKVKTYSLGMRQRLGLAQALLHDPKVLILDEPTNGLDPAGIREMRDHLRILAKERDMAVIVSSHLLSEMEMMCDRIGIIQGGKLIDVQLVNDFVNGSDKFIEMEVSPREAAIKLLKYSFPETNVQVMEKKIIIPLSKEQIPFLVREMAIANIDIFSVREQSRTLEDRFLEVTEKKGEALYAYVDTK